MLFKKKNKVLFLITGKKKDRKEPGQISEEGLSYYSLWIKENRRQQTLLTRGSVFEDDQRINRRKIGTMPNICKGLLYGQINFQGLDVKVWLRIFYGPGCLPSKTIQIVMGGCFGEV